MPAVTAPKMSVLRNACVRSALTLDFHQAAPAVIEEVDQSKE
jgi:hypothetical protein